MGGRNEDRDVPDVRGDDFAAVARERPRFGVSTDSRYEVSSQAELELAA